jgi:hypothetical protein
MAGFWFVKPTFFFFRLEGVFSIQALAGADILLDSFLGNHPLIDR